MGAGERGASADVPGQAGQYAACPLPAVSEAEGHERGWEITRPAGGESARETADGYLQAAALGCWRAVPQLLITGNALKWGNLKYKCLLCYFKKSAELEIRRRTACPYFIFLMLN